MKLSGGQPTHYKTEKYAIWFCLVIEWVDNDVLDRSIFSGLLPLIQPIRWVYFYTLFLLTARLTTSHCAPSGGAIIFYGDGGHRGAVSRHQFLLAVHALMYMQNCLVHQLISASYMVHHQSVHQYKPTLSTVICMCIVHHRMTILRVHALVYHLSIFALNPLQYMKNSLVHHGACPRSVVQNAGQWCTMKFCTIEVVHNIGSTNAIVQFYSWIKALMMFAYIFSLSVWWECCRTDSHPWKTIPHFPKLSVWISLVSTKHIFSV